MKVAFLIEGANHWKGVYQEVDAAIELATVNDCLVFDPIEPHSARLAAEVIAEISEDEWPLFVMLSVSMAGQSDSLTTEIYEQYILPGFVEYNRKRGSTTLPTWLTQLSPETWNEFVDDHVQQEFLASEVTLTKAIRRLLKSVKSAKADISLLNLFVFLENNPQVTHVFSLVDEAHLDLIDDLDFVDVIDKQEMSRHLKINLVGRAVNIELYAGKQGQMNHFLSMEQSFITTFKPKALIKGLWDNVTATLGSVAESIIFFYMINQMQNACQNLGYKTPEVTANPIAVMSNKHSLSNLFITQLQARLYNPPRFFENAGAPVTAQEEEIATTAVLNGPG